MSPADQKEEYSAWEGSRQAAEVQLGLTSEQTPRNEVAIRLTSPDSAPGASRPLPVAGPGLGESDNDTEHPMDSIAVEVLPTSPVVRCEDASAQTARRDSADAPALEAHQSSTGPSHSGWHCPAGPRQPEFGASLAGA